MANKIVFTSSLGPGTTFELRGDEAGLSGYMWQKIDVRSRSPWSDVVYTGFSGKDAKWMGGRPHTFVIRGHAYADTDTNLWTQVDGLLKQNKGQTLWSVRGLGSDPIKSATGGCIILDINFLDHGGDTGIKWPFEIFFTNLGVD